MDHSMKRPTILVIDDELAENTFIQRKVMKTIIHVANELGYDGQQKQRILESIKFFAQYNEHDGKQPAEECAEHYLKTRNGDTEVPVLTFVDNNFSGAWDSDDDVIHSHGEEIKETAREEAAKRGERPPALVWISSDSGGDDIIAARKGALERDVAKLDGEEILDYAKQRHREFQGEDNTVVGYRNRTPDEQVIVHALRDAFEAIVGRPATQPWKARLAAPTNDPAKGQMGV